MTLTLEQLKQIINVYFRKRHITEQITNGVNESFESMAKEIELEENDIPDSIMNRIKTADKKGRKIERG